MYMYVCMLCAHYHSTTMQCLMCETIVKFRVIKTLHSINTNFHVVYYYYTPLLESYFLSLFFATMCFSDGWFLSLPIALYVPSTYIPEQSQ